MTTFQLDGVAPIGEDCRRILVDQTVAALTALSGENRRTGVHEARKGCKRCRALLRLVRGGMAPKTWRELDRGYRGAARVIGPLRDSDVVHETLRSVAAGIGDLVWNVPGAPEQPLVAVQEATRRLAAVQAVVAGADFDEIEADTLLEGLQSSWRDARSAMSEAAEDEDPEVTHDWRKTAKRVYYHLQLVEGLWPPVFGAVVGELDALQETLGAHHDLAIVAAALDRRRTPPEAVDELEVRLRRRTEELRVEALDRGEVVFAAAPKTMGYLVEAVWSATRRAGSRR